MSRCVVISGCSGGGKSTLLEELARRGHATVEEPGRRIVREELAGNGTALPWCDMAAFAGRAIAMAEADLRAVEARDGWVFFDRGLVDAAAALTAAGGTPPDVAGRYHPKVFMVPPWEELFASDAERRHSFDEAVAEYERLCATYPELGYDLIDLPKCPVRERADFMLDALGLV